MQCIVLETGNIKTTVLHAIHVIQGLTGGFGAQQVDPTSSASCTSLRVRHVRN